MFFGRICLLKFEKDIEIDILTILKFFKELRAVQFISSFLPEGRVNYEEKNVLNF